MEGLGQLKKFSDLIGNRTRDLPACSIAPQPSTLPCAPAWFRFLTKNICSQSEILKLKYPLLNFLARQQIHTNAPTQRAQTEIHLIGMKATEKLQHRTLKRKVNTV
jgi:hypothetical protein